MTKKIFLAAAILIFLFGVFASLHAFVGCKDAFSACTEGGCGIAVWAEDCNMGCQASSEVKKIDCKPVAVY